MKKKTLEKGIDKLLSDNNLGVKLDIGCGEQKQPGFVGIDMLDLPGVDIVQNLEEFPWALPDECASLAIASHVVEHINPANGIFLKFMNEVWRVLKPGGEFLISAPYAGSPGFWQDPTHCNGCNEHTWEYFDPAGRTEGMLYHFYKPKPWKIKISTWNINGNLEVVLIKRPLNEVK